MKKVYAVRDREAGNIIDEFNSLAEAEKAIEQYEADDREEDIYEPNFYEVAVSEEDGTMVTSFAATKKAGTKERLLRVRAQLGGLSQIDLSAYAGVPMRTLTSWLNGSRECPDYVIELIERAAGSDEKALEEDRVPSTMERWAVITQDGMDEWITVRGSKADALTEASRQWDRLTDAEKEAQTVFMVGKIHVQLIDPKPHTGRFSWALLENGIDVDGDIYEIAKDYKAGE